MRCLEGHLADSLNLQTESVEKYSENGMANPVEKVVFCERHTIEDLKYFCKSCNVLICKECALIDHPPSVHECYNLSELVPMRVEIINQTIQEGNSAATDILEHSSGHLQEQIRKAKDDIQKTYFFYQSKLEERKQELLKQLRSALSANRPKTYLEFVSNHDAIQVSIKNTFGSIRSSSNVNLSHSKRAPIAAIPINKINSNSSSNEVSSYIQNIEGNGLKGILRQPYSNELTNTSSRVQLNKANSLGNFSTLSVSDININGVNFYENCTNCSEMFQNETSEHFSLANHSDPVLDISSKLLSYPPISEMKRQMIIYHYKFGDLGGSEGKFAEPNGIVVNAQNDIIVADTGNHRIQIFDEDGRFKFQFGECGKKPGQFLHPNRVTVVKTTGDIIITEKFPAHQIQIYNQYGQFVRRFGADILRHPRGVTVDSQGRIIVIECKIIRVIIFNQKGKVLHKFGCSKYLQFPNGVIVNNKQEIFITDNREHCVKVFDYKGVFLRQIGSVGVTNFPIGVEINSSGEILIADNHNHFNLSIYTQDGQLRSVFQSKATHSNCLDIALMGDNFILLACKDDRVYVYSYAQFLPFP